MNNTFKKHAWIVYKDLSGLKCKNTIKYLFLYLFIYFPVQCTGGEPLADICLQLRVSQIGHLELFSLKNKCRPPAELFALLKPAREK